MIAESRKPEFGNSSSLGFVHCRQRSIILVVLLRLFFTSCDLFYGRFRLAKDDRATALPERLLEFSVLLSDGLDQLIVIIDDCKRTERITRSVRSRMCEDGQTAKDTNERMVREEKTDCLLFSRARGILVCTDSAAHCASPARL